jgi:hypothetical protein
MDFDTLVDLTRERIQDGGYPISRQTVAIVLSAAQIVARMAEQLGQDTEYGVRP